MANPLSDGFFVRNFTLQSENVSESSENSATTECHACLLIMISIIIVHLYGAQVTICSTRFKNLYH